jgi:hypothetical protein
MRLQRIICASYAAYARQNARFSADFSQCVNCYGISCHRKVTVNSTDVRNGANVAMPMHKNTLPPMGVVADQLSPMLD